MNDLIVHLPGEDPANEAASLAARLIETTGVNLFLTGKAGTGKTTFLHRLRQNSSKRIVVLAPTGIAAINAGGMTIHSFFQLGFSPFVPGHTATQKKYDRFSREKLRVVRTMDILVIDEISMVRADLLDAVDQSLRRHRHPGLPFGGVQLLLIGDLAQLPPVVKEEEWELLRQYYDSPYFFSSLALRQTRCHTIELNKVYRQNEGQFLDILNRIRGNAVDMETLRKLNTRYIPSFSPPSSEQWIRLVTHNAQARSINESALRELPSQSREFRASTQGDFPEYSFPVDMLLTLKVGAHVMFVKNDSSDERRYYNGLLGVVVGFGENTVMVEPVGEGGMIMIGPETWTNNKYAVDDATGEIREETIGQFTQIPLRLAWAITIHKSQGLTFDRAIIDAASSFTHGQTYVALSRCRTIEGLVLERPIDHGALISDPAVINYLSTSSSNTPDAAEIGHMQKAYALSQLDDLFDFVPLMKAVEGLSRIMASDFSTLCPQAVESWRKMHIHVNEDMVKVALRFGIQYHNMLAPSESLPEDNAVDGRLRKGAAYFLQLLLELDMLFVKVPASHDNKKTQKTLRKCREELRTELLLKMAMMEHVAQHGFSIDSYLRAKARAWLEIEGNPQTSRRNRRASSANVKSSDAKAPTTAKLPTAAVSTAVDSDVRDEALYEALRLWRLDKSREINRPAYCVLYNYTLTGIVNTNPSTLEELAAIKGMSAAKVKMYGQEILTLLRSHSGKG